MASAAEALHGAALYPTLTGVRHCLARGRRPIRTGTVRSAHGRGSGGSRRKATTRELSIKTGTPWRAGAGPAGSGHTRCSRLPPAFRRPCMTQGKQDQSGPLSPAGPSRSRPFPKTVPETCIPCRPVARQGRARGLFSQPPRPRGATDRRRKRKRAGFRRPFPNSSDPTDQTVSPNGMSRNRLPVAWKTALPMAGAIGASAGSPQPAAWTSNPCGTMWTFTCSGKLSDRTIW